MAKDDSFHSKVSPVSLPRILEPAPLDPFEEASEYQAMDHSGANSAFLDDLTAAEIGQHVIDLGCGPAAIPIELCRRDAAVSVMAIDGEVEMLEIAKIEVDMEGMIDRITLQHADVGEMDDFEEGMADTVISNSLIHHLADPESGLRTCLRLVRPGGRLFIRDLYRPATQQDVDQLVSQYTKDENEFARQLFRQSLHAALTLDEIRSLAGGLGIAASHVQMTSDRHWTIDWRT